MLAASALRIPIFSIPWVSCPRSWTEAGQWLGQATQRHLEAMPRTHTHTLIIPEAIGPHTIQDHSSDFMA